MPSRRKPDISAMVPEPAYMVSEIELVYKTKIKAKDRPKITTSRDAYEVLRKTWDENKIELCEQFKVLYLNRSNRVLSVFCVSQGSSTGTVADEKHILVAGMLQNASAMILAHNHPSGNPDPSAADKELTRKLFAAGKLVGITGLDHIILHGPGDTYTSFADDYPHYLP